MSKGFATDNLISKKSKKKVISNEPQGRLISWSPWPPANFQTRYPAFPLVLTILINYGIDLSIVRFLSIISITSMIFLAVRIFVKLFKKLNLINF